MPNESLLEKYGRPVPRYTSYPTAPHFHDGVTDETYRAWLSGLPGEAALSLYVHIPFCDTMCWFCGCQMQHVRRYEPIAAYLPVLYREIEAVAGLGGAARRVTHIHWGGGSPTILTPDDISALAHTIRDQFTIAADAEFAVEIDPRGFDLPRAQALAEAGLTRASIGVQDFSPKFQAAINRHQSFEETKASVHMLRDLGVASINIDLVYGLPYQSDIDLRRTIELTVSLSPDRVSVFGYAHVPWMKVHQRLIPTDSLPGAIARYDQMELAANLFVEAGYRRIGIDHFARPEDDLAKAGETGDVHRNFQGYTTDAAEALIGLGSSAISRLPQGYVQNQKAIGRYVAAVGVGGLAVEKGRAFSGDDRMRGWFIERLLSDFRVSKSDLERNFGSESIPLAREAEAVAQEEDGLLESGTSEFRISERGKPFARTVAARFDAYLADSAARHSSAV